MKLKVSKPHRKVTIQLGYEASLEAVGLADAQDETVTSWRRSISSTKSAGGGTKISSYMNSVVYYVE